MRTLFRIALAVLVVALSVPAGALAKGASQATVTGPGLASPLVLPGEGEPGGEELMAIADEAGFFAAVFGQSPNPMLAEQPSGYLGPRYTVVYTMPGPNNELDQLVQDVYPFAEPSPVTYVEPGQRFWTTESTHGGWFVADTVLTEQLLAAGVPEWRGETASSGSSWTVAGGVGLLAVIVALGAASAVVVRRRMRSAAA